MCLLHSMVVSDLQKARSRSIAAISVLDRRHFFLIARKRHNFRFNSRGRLLHALTPPRSAFLYLQFLSSLQLHSTSLVSLKNFGLQRARPNISAEVLRTRGRDRPLSMLSKGGVCGPRAAPFLSRKSCRTR